jgi:hypothetical protein
MKGNKNAVYQRLKVVIIEILLLLLPYSQFIQVCIFEVYSIMTASIRLESKYATSLLLISERERCLK